MARRHPAHLSWHRGRGVPRPLFSRSDGGGNCRTRQPPSAELRGNYSAYVQAKAVQRAQQRKAYDQQQAEIQRQEEFIRRNIAGQKPVRRRAGRKCWPAWSGWRSPPPTSPRCNSISPPAVVRVMRSSSAARSASRLEITPYCATCRVRSIGATKSDSWGQTGPERVHSCVC